MSDFVINCENHWDTGYPDCLTEIPRRNDLSPRQKERIMGTNIAELMHIA